MDNLLTLQETSASAESLVSRSSDIRRTFDHRTQDSGNVSWLVDTMDGPLFVKSAGTAVPPPDAPAPLLDHPQRIALLENAVELSRSCDHQALAKLRNVISTATGPALVYEAAPAKLVGVERAVRTNPGSPYQRFANLPAPRMLTVLDALIDLHVAFADRGWIACDLYDGCLIVARDDRLTVVDLDPYHRGSFINTTGRMFGSDRFMAPEEFTLGATIDQRSTVFTIARLVTHFSTRLTEDLASFVGSTTSAEALRRACEPDPSARFPSVSDFAAAWTAGR